MNHAKPKQKKVSVIQIIRAVIQLTAFVLIPGLFIRVFTAVSAVYTALISGTFLFSEQIANLLLIAGTFLITAIWGRFFCGFICSFGAMQDLLWRAGKHLVKRPLISERADRALKYLKYFVLAFIVVGVWTFGVGEGVLWSPWTVFGMYASPFGGFPTEMMFLSIGGLLLLMTVIGSLLIERFFCKYLCPLGALFALASKFRIFRVKKPGAACGSCRMCTKRCAMAIPLYRYDEIRSGECIDCMKCTSVCRRDNVAVAAAPAVSGTLAAISLAGVTFMGTLQNTNQVSGAATVPSATAPVQIISTEASGKYKDGVYTGSAAGFRGTIEVSVIVSSGYIDEITLTSYNDDREFIAKASDVVIPEIIENQGTDVDAVSGATYSSRGIINAVKDALEAQLSGVAAIAPITDETTAPATEAETIVDNKEPEADIIDEEDHDDQGGSTNSGYADGVYYGSGTGFRGTTQVAVTVEGGRITDITVTSYQDDNKYFTRAQSGVINAILSQQSVDVASVSGATFSSNSIKAAVADALNLDYTNPNSSSGGFKKH